MAQSVQNAGENPNIVGMLYSLREGGHGSTTQPTKRISCDDPFLDKVGMVNAGLAADLVGLFVLKISHVLADAAEGVVGILPGLDLLANGDGFCQDKRFSAGFVGGGSSDVSRFSKLERGDVQPEGSCAGDWVVGGSTASRSLISASVSSPSLSNSVLNANLARPRRGESSLSSSETSRKLSRDMSWWLKSTGVVGTTLGLGEREVDSSSK